MPWTPADATRHIEGLTAHQRTVWARVANAALRACLANGGSERECDARAIRQANAAAQRAPTKAIKAEDDGALRILAIPFGGPLEDGRDTDGEFFSAETDLALDWFPTQRPLLFHHGLDDSGPGIEAVGRVDVASAEKTAEGWWVRAWLDKQHAYFRQIGELLEQDALYASSGAMPHLVRKAQNGEITRWPWVELSLTPTPANLFATVEAGEAKAHYKAAGLTPPPTLDADGVPSYSDTLERLTDEIPEFAALSRKLAENRLKVGRPISAARRDRLGALMTAMREAAKELDALLKETEPKQDDAGKGVTEAVLTEFLRFQQLTADMAAT